MPNNSHLLWFLCLGRQQQLEDEDPYVEADQDLHRRVERSVEPPAERPGERRMAEMKKLYGAEAAKIQAMEAAMQLIFDRNCDRKQPKYWPIIPLKLWAAGLCSDLAQSYRIRCFRLGSWKNKLQILVWGLGGESGRDSVYFFGLFFFYSVCQQCSQSIQPTYSCQVVIGGTGISTLSKIHSFDTHLPWPCLQET